MVRETDGVRIAQRFIGGKNGPRKFNESVKPDG
jgi:hypothetical protein